MTFASYDFSGTGELSSADASFTKVTSYTVNAVITGASRLRADASGNAVYRNTATPPSADYEVSADIYVNTTTDTNAGVIARCSSSAATFYYARWRGTVGHQLFKFVSGTATQLGSTVATTYSDGTTAQIKLRVEGTTISLYKDGEPSPIISVTDSDITAAGFAGLYINNGGYTTGPHLDHWAAAALGGGDTTAPTLSSPTGAGGLGVCSGTVSTDEANGTLYAVATASATAPSAAQVKAGQDHTGTAALRVVSQAVSATGTQTIASGAISGGAGTRWLHYVHPDSAGNTSNVVSSASFEVTAAATTLAVSVPDAAGVTGVNGVVLSAAAPGAGVSVIATVAGASFNGSGMLNIDITGLGVTVGALRYVVLSKSDGTTGQSPAPFCAQGPVAAS